MVDEKNTIAIVGGGPRGLSALENLYAQKSLKNNDQRIFTLLFEAKKSPGAGQVYDLQQPDTNWLNLSERGLTIPSRNQIVLGKMLIPSFPSYQEWTGYNEKEVDEKVPDKFPLRSALGKYLNLRFLSIASVLERNGLLKVIKGVVVKTNFQNERFSIVLDNHKTYFANEMVLTIGHQPTRNSEQISNWLNYSSKTTLAEVTSKPYPISDILCTKILGETSSVGLRGFGLAMIDVMRALTVGLGGNFKIEDEKTRKMSYLPSGKEPLYIVPFSLDGLPMAPKPLNLQIDRWFFPTEREKEVFGKNLKYEANLGNAKNLEFLVNEIAPIIVRVFENLKSKADTSHSSTIELPKAITSWLLNSEFNHQLIVPRNTSVENTLQAFVEMATGSRPISLDFCIGQVWRHCQPTLYEALSFSNLDEDVIVSIIELDERLKRYSYGPPVDSLQQMLALIKAGIINFDFVRDPKIEMTKKGWRLKKDSNSVVVNLMVNSVLDAPKLSEVNSPIICALLNESMVRPLHNDLGIDTHNDGRVLLPEGSDQKRLAVLGRLAKGTLIGVDAILECFGERSELWARGTVDRLTAKN